MISRDNAIAVISKVPKRRVIKKRTTRIATVGYIGPRCIRPYNVPGAYLSISLDLCLVHKCQQVAAKPHFQLCRTHQYLVKTTTFKCIHCDTPTPLRVVSETDDYIVFERLCVHHIGNKSLPDECDIETDSDYE